MPGSLPRQLTLRPRLISSRLAALGNYVAPCAVTPGNFRRDSAATVVSSPPFRMKFDFDTAIPRHDTDSQKWQKYTGRDILPMWVADMDFKCAPAILEALHARVDHGLFGYARPVKSTVDAVVAAMERNYGWKIDAAWIVWLPGLVVGLNVTALAYAEPGEVLWEDIDIRSIGQEDVLLSQLDYSLVPPIFAHLTELESIHQLANPTLQGTSQDSRPVPPPARFHCDISF